jgi:hypothetical protein
MLVKPTSLVGSLILMDWHEAGAIFSLSQKGEDRGEGLAVPSLGSGGIEQTTSSP